jgi:3-phenylpropionate/trans-cinnamate dioxygenase ferredoxin subunit
MSQYIKVTTTADIANGKMKEFHVGDKVITIANTDGELLAFDGICTHAHCSLAGGYLDGYTVTCYCHGAMFDVSNGEVLAPPATSPLNIYNVKVEGDDIFVEV